MCKERFIWRLGPAYTMCMQSVYKKATAAKAVMQQLSTPPGSHQYYHNISKRWCSLSKHQHVHGIQGMHKKPKEVAEVAEVRTQHGLSRGTWSLCKVPMVLSRWSVQQARACWEKP